MKKYIEESEISGLIDALSFYANGENHNRRFPLFYGGLMYDQNEGLPSIVENDGGETARKALAAFNKNKTEKESTL